MLDNSSAAELPWTPALIRRATARKATRSPAFAARADSSNAGSIPASERGGGGGGGVPAVGQAGTVDVCEWGTAEAREARTGPEGSGAGGRAQAVGGCGRWSGRGPDHAAGGAEAGW